MGTKTPLDVTSSFGAILEVGFQDAQVHQGAPVAQMESRQLLAIENWMVEYRVSRYYRLTQGIRDVTSSFRTAFEVVFQVSRARQDEQRIYIHKMVRVFIAMIMTGSLIPPTSTSATPYIRSTRTTIDAQPGTVPSPGLTVKKITPKPRLSSMESTAPSLLPSFGPHRYS
jgi:hypothetical protein